MFYKIVDNSLEKCPKNGVLNDGTAISNMPLYFEVFEDEANKNGYYKLSVGIDDSTLNEKKGTYFLDNGFINFKEGDEENGD